MADYTVTARVWDDADGDGVRDAVEPFVSGRAVSLFRRVGMSDVLLDTKTTDSFGQVVFFATGLGSPETFAVVPDLPPDWEATNGASWVTTLPAGSSSHDFGQRGAAASFRPASSWVRKVAWVPGVGLRVTFHDRDSVPTVTVWYPKTTFADYAAFAAAASAGRHVHAALKGRPYVVVGLEP